MTAIDSSAADGSTRDTLAAIVGEAEAGTGADAGAGEIRPTPIELHPTVPATAPRPRRRRYSREIARIRGARAGEGSIGGQDAAPAEAADAVVAAENAAAEDAAAAANAAGAADTAGAAGAAGAAGGADTAGAADAARARKREKSRTRAPGGSRAGKSPRANTGRKTAADELGTPELKAALTSFGEAYCARGAGEAAMIRALATAHDIAQRRAEATLAESGRGEADSDEQVFSWHFTSVLGEFAFATHDSDQSLRARGYDASVLVGRFPGWVTAIERGQVDTRHSREMLKHSRHLGDKYLAEYGAVVLEFAERHTPGETGTFAEEAASTIAAEEFEAEHARARRRRSVTVSHDGLGMAVLNAYLPSELASPIAQLIDKGAREVIALDKEAQAEHRQAMRDARARGAVEPPEFEADTRSISEIRADVFAQTLLCSTPGESRVKAVVSVTVPALSLLEGRKNGTAPALLDGIRPMGFEEARQLAGEATSFQRVLTDPATGHVSCVDTYEPSKSLRRFLQVRDRTCAFPGCIRPAVQCDADHTHPFSEGGETHDGNMAHLCRGHHVQKHEKPWTVTNLGGGVLQWVTPLGQVVTAEPRGYGPRFVPKVEDDPPPF
ncbi:HNH endonuclease signature motif containing protein [Gulosibacter molinativorax]|uniref:DUF222 domain-containing protein n=1 Tax=Gulosibacter molinativorax TaxID=256821 RepID=A0ABT7C7P1_9MICO|nr:HNH endonuclease signature motif containing protein [Gulosibacter molinativorax]MDJ1371231.1 DUF222 domain-containing protein [Gulosibacter molinativorax]QUY63047.1 HNH endonuclease [Gulosibacter molinativorax]